MNKKPLILVTNDDGIFAPGIKALVQIMQEIGEVFVVAPDSPQSGQGHAITLNEPLRLRKIDAFPDVISYECTGTPADCVKLAKNVLLKDRNIDLCVSGINHGSNASINIIYSGTMSAAMEASLEGIDSIGFSFLDYSFEADFKPCSPYIKGIVEAVLKDKLKDCKLLNVNIPSSETHTLKGIRICRQAMGYWEEEFDIKTDPRGETYYWLTGKFHLDDEGSDTDLKALEEGYISVVPSGHDLTINKAIPSMRYLENINHA